ncbi:MAG: DUF459 domain-containing protein [Pyrinomonadaceae bacterium]|nr:DUF459 domain-containing protein [Pyrinomonadaceae bacterium]
MFKKDLEILVTALCVVVLLFFADFNSFTKTFSSINSDLENAKQSEFYKSYSNFKESENSFWAGVKGTKSNAGDVANVLNETPVTEAPQPKEPEQPQKLTAPLKFLLVGDSMMLVWFGPALENSLLKFNGVSVVREGVYSTGLNRIDYYDWFTKTDELIAKNKPDVLVIMFGGNDGQGMLDKNGKPHDFGTESWKEIYHQRVNIYLSRFSPKVKKIYWVGHPITGNESFLNKFQTMNSIYQSECAKFSNAVFISTWERFSVNGEYRQTIPDDDGLWQIAKSSDGVHVTEFGGKIMANFVIKEILKDADLK